MAINYFLGQSRQQLESALAERQAELLAGKTVTRIAAGDADATSAITLPTTKVIEMILSALNLIDPDTYPASSIRRIDRTIGQVRQKLWVSA